MENQR